MQPKQSSNLLILIYISIGLHKITWTSFDYENKSKGQKNFTSKIIMEMLVQHKWFYM